MSRKGSSICPQCGCYGVTLGKVEQHQTVVSVTCNSCGYSWNSRSRFTLSRARQQMRVEEERKDEST